MIVLLLIFLPITQHSMTAITAVITPHILPEQSVSGNNAMIWITITDTHMTSIRTPIAQFILEGE